MEIGIVGIGKIGSGLMRRLQHAGHTVVAYDQNEANQTAITDAGATPATSLADLTTKLSPSRIVWLMIPAGKPVVSSVQELSQLLDAGDIVIDGGNSRFQDSQAHAGTLAKRDITFVDVGVSGGVAGETEGYALMAGGEVSVIKKLQPIFTALSAPRAFAHVGPVGAGHFVKMVHNAVEYGMMQAIAEGFDLLKSGPYQEIDVAAVGELWSHGTIVRSYLMELAARALARDQDLSGIASYVEDSGEGRWSVEAAVAHGVPFMVNTAALYARFNSRQPNSFAYKLLAALRQEFGGHAIKEEK